MKCPTCNWEIPQHKKTHAPLLACPRCLADKSYQALLQFHRQFVAGLRKGERLILLTKPVGKPRWHLVLSDYNQAWCGETVNGRWTRQRLPYPRIDTVRTPLCETCQRVFEELVEEPAEVA